jgi:hypothetical protein
LIGIVGHIIGAVTGCDSVFDDDDDSSALVYFSFEVRLLSRLEQVGRSYREMRLLLQREIANAREKANADAAVLASQVKDFIARSRIFLKGNRAERERLINNAARQQQSAISRSGRRLLFCESFGADIEKLDLTEVAHPARLKTFIAEYDGVISAREDALLFDGACGTKHRRVEIPLAEIEFVFNRQSGLDPPGFEVFTARRMSYLFALPGGSGWLREQLRAVPVAPERARFSFFAACRAACGSIWQTLPAVELLTKSKITEKWERCQLSNYTYLYFLNFAHC